MEVIDNILEPNNEAGWLAFGEVSMIINSINLKASLWGILLSLQNEVGSEMILSNAESYGQYFVQALMNENVNVSSSISETMAITMENIGTYMT